MRQGLAVTVQRVVGRVALAGSMCLACTGAAEAQSATAPGGGIARLTAATRQEAVDCGNSGASCALVPYDVCPEEAEHYSVRLITPFSRVASAALEARKNAQPLGRMGPGAVNQWGIALSVAPAERSATAEAIQRVEIRRDDGTVIQPRWTTIGPVTTKITGGTTVRLSRGFFVFPVEAFLPTGDIAVVFVGQSSETRCTIDRQQLSTLR